METNSPPPSEIYGRRRDRFEERRQRAARTSRRLTAWRAAAFLTALGLGLAGELTEGGLSAGLYAGAIAALAVFAVMVIRHRRVRDEEERSAALAGLNEKALSRLRRDWEQLPEPATAAEEAPSHHPYSADLDLFGPASVRALLDTVSTAPGAVCLREWLLSAADPEEGPSPGTTRRRQRLVRALAPRVDFRDGLAVHGRLSAPVEAGALGRFVEWCEAEPWLPGHTGVRLSGWILPLLTWGLALAHLTGIVGHAWWLFPVVATLYMAGRTSGPVHEIFERASCGQVELDRWAESIESISGLGQEPDLAELAEPFLEEDEGAPERLRRLAGIVRRADARAGLVHFFLQVLFFWDVHVLRDLERWQRRTGHRVRGWIEGLGRVDALCALAALRHAHPEWTFPDVVDSGPEAPRRLEAEALGHPLLPPGECVRNDVTAGPPGTFLLVTGSNMSGKSTLLRALGLNTVLGRAGAPVCARRMRLPPLGVRCSIQVTDSVIRGISQYMAELERVRGVVEAARKLAPEAAGDGEESGNGGGSPEGRPPPRLLYLLDEPLQGTNEAERREAVRMILEELLELGAVGAVATHDLRLHHTESLRDSARAVHFRGEVRGDGAGPRLTFDYRLRSGPATSTNALDLLRLAGLGRKGGR